MLEAIFIEYKYQYIPLENKCRVLILDLPKEVNNFNDSYKRFVKQLNTMIACSNEIDDHDKYNLNWVNNVNEGSK